MNDAAEPEVPLPDLRTIAMVILALLGVIYTLHFARVFFLPVVLALLLNFLLSPVIRLLGRARLPEPVAAAVVILVLVGALGVGVYNLSDPMQGWLARAPQNVADARTRLRKLIKPVEQMNRAAAQMETATQPAGAPAREVVVRGPSLSERIFGSTQSFLVGGFEVLILLYFLLASGDLFLQKMVRVLPGYADKKKAVLIARAAESSVSAYLGAVTLINTGLGIVVALAMAALGMPNPVLWGVAAGLFEFIPYVGATVMTVFMGITALVTFDSVGRALLVPAVFLAIEIVQANVVSPIVLARRLTLNPVAVFMGLLFWTLVWGVGGAFLAVPLLATLKIVCDHIVILNPVGEFLGR